METTTSIEAHKNSTEIVVIANGEEWLNDSGFRCAFGPDTKRYQTTVAVSALVSNGEVHSIGFHKSVAAAQKVRPASYHNDGTYAIWGLVSQEA
jgi:hypothetical protein